MSAKKDKHIDRATFESALGDLGGDNAEIILKYVEQLGEESAAYYANWQAAIKAVASSEETVLAIGQRFRDISVKCAAYESDINQIVKKAIESKELFIREEAYLAGQLSFHSIVWEDGELEIKFSPKNIKEYDAQKEHKVTLIKAKWLDNE